MSINGFVLYEGPSTLGGDGIVAILTLRSSNTKTGSIPQLWILRADTEPHTAHRLGLDSAVCGGCRHARDGSCYVVLHRGPLSVYRTWKRGRYPDAGPGMVRVWQWLRLHQPRAIRLGAYGDPVAIPFASMLPLFAAARVNGATLIGYTHQWRSLKAYPWKGHLMASVDTPKERGLAARRGWRTFRTKPPGEAVDASEVVCPATTRGMTCNACRACDGLASPGRSSVVIDAHGAPYKVKRYSAGRASA